MCGAWIGAVVMYGPGFRPVLVLAAAYTRRRLPAVYPTARRARQIPVNVIDERTSVRVGPARGPDSTGPEPVILRPLKAANTQSETPSQTLSSPACTRRNPRLRQLTSSIAAGGLHPAPQPLRAQISADQCDAWFSGF
jgi:hypothetical protein